MGTRRPIRAASGAPSVGSEPTKDGLLACRGGAGLGVLLDLLDVRLQLLLLNLLGSAHLPLDLGAHIRHADHDEPCLTGVQILPEVLEVSTAHPASGVPRHRT